MTPRLMHNDDSTSLSSAADLEQVGMMAEAEIIDSGAIYEEIGEPLQQKVIFYFISNFFLCQTFLGWSIKITELNQCRLY